MSCFDDLYNSVMLDFTPQRQHIYEHILIEENQFLKNPNGIFQRIYKIILNLYEKKQYSKEIKIYIKDIINSAFEVELKDSVLNDFIYCLLNLSLFDKDDNPNFSKMLKQSKIFPNIKKFLKSIYDDKIFVIKNQNTEESYTQIYENKKKVKLMFKWFYKNLSEGI